MPPEYGSAVFQAHYKPGTAEIDRIEIVSADPVIGISLQLLADADPADGLVVDDDGCLLLAGDTRYRYQPVGLAGTVLICERLQEEGPDGRDVEGPQTGGQERRGAHPGAGDLPGDDR